MDLPTLKLPPAQKYETISIPLPTADVPYYKPLVVPPSDLRDHEGQNVKTSDDEPKETGIRKVDIPFTNKKVSFKFNNLIS